VRRSARALDVGVPRGPLAVQIALEALDLGLLALDPVLQILRLLVRDLLVGVEVVDLPLQFVDQLLGGDVLVVEVRLRALEVGEPLPGF
jgi:hypothetical protein